MGAGESNRKSTRKKRIKSKKGKTRGLSKQLLLKARTKKIRYKKSKERIERLRIRRDKMLSTGFLVLAITSTLPKQRMITSGKPLKSIDYQRPSGSLWFVCTGNTCRSAALKVAAYERGIMIPTCGSGVRTPGDPMTSALKRAYKTLKKPNNVLKFANNHRSQSCLKPRGQPKCSLLKKDTVYVVVAEKNAKQIEEMASQCGRPKPSILVLSKQPHPSCKQFGNDPYNHSEAAAIEEGRPFTNSNRIKEKQVYEELVGQATECLEAIGPSLGLL